jgi:serine/threonine protein kinase
MDQLQPGQMLGPYRIINQVGQGGMATVYKAYQPSMDRNVAIKVLPGQLASSTEFRQRFQQEARIIAKLEHPHILPVFDYGESDGVTYFVMRYLDAGTLSEKMVKGRPLPLGEIDHLFTQLAEALSYAHGFGIIHRDLKPSNALIDSHGNVFLTDFGIAKLLESASPRLTQTDAIMGTPAYISPEQARADKVDQRSDIYSLGIILYEMVTGRVPFVAETPLAVILKHVSDSLPPPSSIKSDVPEAIEKVVLKSLAKHPGDRFATVAEFLAAWKDALEEARSAPRRTAAVSAPPEPPMDTPASSSYRTPAPGPKASTTPKATTGSAGWVTWAVGCLVALCGLSVLGGGAFFLFNAANQPPTATSRPTQTAVPPATSTPRATATAVPDTSETILEDDFSDDSIWGLLDAENASIEYADEALRIELFTESWMAWTTPDDEVYENVHIEVTAHNNDGESTTEFGIVCYQQEDGTSFYYAVITRAGDYAIVLAADGEDDIFLTNDGEWGTSDLIENKDSYRLGMDCGNGTLSLYVDGQLVDSAEDDTYEGGTPGVVVLSGDSVSAADVSFDDFLMTTLP